MHWQTSADSLNRKKGAAFAKRNVTVMLFTSDGSNIVSKNDVTHKNRGVPWLP